MHGSIKATHYLSERYAYCCNSDTNTSFLSVEAMVKERTALVQADCWVVSGFTKKYTVWLIISWLALGRWSEKAENIAEEMQVGSKTEREYDCRSHQLCRDGIIKNNKRGC